MKKFFKGLLNVILWIWQLPQHIGALFAIFFSGAKKTTLELDGEKFTIYVAKSFMNSGVSLGNYIILDDVYTGYRQSTLYKKLTIKHEMGHSVQSKILGPLYLIVIGLFSAGGNIWDRMFYVGKKDQVTREKWYYNLPWEKWADKLSGAYELRQKYFEECSIYGTANKQSGRW